jgi:uncharacterized protein YdhG (YjbR/CyaY superfamily)
MTSFTALVKKFPKEQQLALLQTIEAAEKLYPHAKRAIAWGMPTLQVGEDNLCHVMGFKNHNSFFPSSGAIAEQLANDLKSFKVSKGTIQFDLVKPFPSKILKKVLAARLQQINDSYPKKSGISIEYYKNGAVKFRGKVKAGVMQGKWEFFRLDGSLMRSGSFINGEQVGVWRTYDSQGKLVKETSFDKVVR